MAEEVHLYLYPDLRNRMEHGRDRFLGTFVGLLRARGWRVVVHDDSAKELAQAPHRAGHALVRMIPPPHDRALTFRRTYLRPFWHLERVAERWNWPVARARFDASGVAPNKPERFLNNLRQRHYPRVTPSREGFVLVPLQGRLLEHRNFQSMSPIAMLETLLQHDPRPLHATLHPKEPPGPEERAALDALAARHQRLTISTGTTAALLPCCDYVATQTSAVAFSGYLLEKPALLFGQTDFHHIATTVADLGAEEALARAPGMTPNFAAYLWWRLRDHAIDDSRPDLETRILRALRRAGWPVH
ncbi:hypothetical protein [Sagittula salina]|uniref:Capsule polysaccharide biosynthesis protein n=1 Tax=Sagittula salina TaxID=2820268 RepID=A0A940S2R6_9RHOB|nr:hypothetical protein [Sagittula salina]MBP0484356.1 hypothetical protein [Sagittula salina]